MGDATHASNPEPLRRWAPKPEQIMILEPIFNSGMVNPSKDQTKNIRKLLERFGPVGDANIFYWFQNRRSRFRRRQRKIQESKKGGGVQPQAEVPAFTLDCGDTTQYENFTSVGFGPNSVSLGMNSGSSFLAGSSSSSYALDGSDTFTTTTTSNNNYDYLFSCLAPSANLVQEYDHNPMFFSADDSGLNYHPEVITVFINGIATHVKRECLHVTNMFGSDYVMCDSSGLPLPVNETGVLAHSLEHGHHYLLVKVIMNTHNS